jgi:hypothetical protein
MMRKFAHGVLALLLGASSGLCNTITVTSTADTGAGTLRQAILDAIPGDIITFDLDLPATIAVTSETLVIDKDLTLAGTGAGQLTIQCQTGFVYGTIQINSGAAVTISGVTISGGFNLLAGAIDNEGTLNLDECSVTQNYSTEFGSLAGGIFNHGTLNITASTVSNNLSNYGAGGIYNQDGVMTILNSTISSNTGGFLSTGNLNVPVSPGGGIYSSGGTVILESTTLTHNFADPDAGGDGIYHSGGEFTLVNCIVADNGREDLAGAFASLGYNLIGNLSDASFTPTIGDQIGTADSPIDPMLGPLQDNGGPTFTHALLPGSPAIDQGGPIDRLTTDQRGQTRPVDDPAIAPSEGGDNRDIGAFEAQFSQSLNISTRANVLTDDNILDGGFIITGSDPKTVLIRGLGPSLTQFMLTSVLADPVLELHDSAGLITANDNWQDSQAAEIEATGIPPTDPAEAAIVATLSPGAYTAVLEGKDGGVGTGLVEIYDLDAIANSRLANISTRGFVDTGDNVLIGGFITGVGAVPAKIVVRAIGPSLAAIQVTDPLQDPSLEIHDQSGATIAFNDNWKDSQAAEIQATGLAPTDDDEAAIVLTLANAPYTAIVRGVNETVGVALVEVYDLD